MSDHPGPPEPRGGPDPSGGAPSAPRPDVVTYYGPDGQVAYKHQVGSPPGDRIDAGRLPAPPNGGVPTRTLTTAVPRPGVDATAGPGPTGSPAAAHKVVPRPTKAHRRSHARVAQEPAARPGVAPLRRSQLPYRIGLGRRVRSAIALVVLSLVLAGAAAAVLLAVVAGIASAISHAASP